MTAYTEEYEQALGNELAKAINELLDMLIGRDDVASHRKLAAFFADYPEAHGIVSRIADVMAGKLPSAPAAHAVKPRLTVERGGAA